MSTNSERREAVAEDRADLDGLASTWLLDDARLDVIRPGDTLVVRAAGSWTQQQAHFAKAFIEERLPGVTALVLAGVDQLAVYRPGGGVVERGFVGLTIDQHLALSLVDRALVDAWVTANGVDLGECRGIRIDPDGAAHFDTIFDATVVPLSWYWLCVPEPTPPPDVAWQPWVSAVEDVAPVDGCDCPDCAAVAP